MSIYESILDTVGKTPIVKLNKLAPDHVALYVKVESFNPLGSVKDRLALGVIEAAEKNGRLFIFAKMVGTALKQIYMHIEIRTARPNLLSGNTRNREAYYDQLYHCLSWGEPTRNTGSRKRKFCQVASLGSKAW